MDGGRDDEGVGEGAASGEAEVDETAASEVEAGASEEACVDDGASEVDEGVSEDGASEGFSEVFSSDVLCAGAGDSLCTAAGDSLCAAGASLAEGVSLAGVSFGCEVGSAEGVSAGGLDFPAAESPPPTSTPTCVPTWASAPGVSFMLCSAPTYLAVEEETA